MSQYTGSPGMFCCPSCLRPIVLPQPVQQLARQWQPGCVCPPGANKDCENPMCPRKNYFAKAQMNAQMNAQMSPPK
jgi:hypothetical protein